MRNITIYLVVVMSLFILSGPAFAAALDERQVVATGVGFTADEAKRQAYRNAIQSVIGAMAVAETLVDNNTLVRDKVLSHSDGYITKVEQVGKGGVLTMQEVKIGNEDAYSRDNNDGGNVIGIAINTGREGGWGRVTPLLTGLSERNSPGIGRAQRLTRPVTFLVSDTELRAVTNVRCTVSNM